MPDVPALAWRSWALVTDLDRETLVELTVLVGYYRTLAQLMHIFGIGIPVSS
ncbi:MULTISPECIES: hypothetical protein [Amycolatopsis]|uniref:Uncharacterized protein n=1 Tax=Amycolatopsis albidoflavus TaxID=102226 RepID=A0ABW5HXN8_9PSEU